MSILFLISFIQLIIGINNINNLTINNNNNNNNNNMLTAQVALSLIIFPSLSSTLFRHRFTQTLIFSFTLEFIFIIMLLFGNNNNIIDQYNTAWSSSNNNNNNSDIYIFSAYIILITFTNIIFSIVSYRSEKKNRKDFLRLCALQNDQNALNTLLTNMLPLSIIIKLRSGNDMIYEYYTNASVLFSYIHNFDLHSASMEPIQLVRVLNLLFSVFDELTDQHKLYKVETIGDAYLVSAGCPTDYYNEAHADSLALLALDMHSLSKNIKVIHDQKRRNMCIIKIR